MNKKIERFLKYVFLQISFERHLAEIIVVIKEYSYTIDAPLFYEFLKLMA